MSQCRQRDACHQPSSAAKIPAFFELLMGLLLLVLRSVFISNIFKVLKVAVVFVTGDFQQFIILSINAISIVQGFVYASVSVTVAR
jgi:hypothetical protein